MKFSNLLFGIVLFSGFAFIMFGLASNMGENYGSNDAADYSTLAGEYNIVKEASTYENSTTRKISNTLDDAGFDTIAAGVAAVDQAAEGTKLIKNSVGTIDRMIETTSGDTSGLINPIFKDVILAIITISTVLMILYMFMRFKAET